MGEPTGDPRIERFLDQMERRGFSRRELLQRAVAGGTALTLPALIAACGGGDDEEAGGAPTGGGDTATGAGEPNPGGNLRLAVVGGGNSETLDFNQSLNEIDVVFTRAMFEGLTDFDPEGEVINVLAESMEPNSDASVWQCKLLDGVTFHDGKPFVAEDVVFTFQYWWDPKTKSQAKPQLEGVVKPENIRAVDDLTVEFTLDSPNSFFPGIMADRATKIMSSGTTIESNGTKPNGTGPFKFVTWTRGERCEMERFENYHVSGRPYLDELTTFSINEPTARLNALVAGQVDALSQLAPQLAGTVEGNEALTLIEKTGGTFTCQYMDMSKPPFQSNDVRQAFRYMVDREQIIETALGGRGELGNDLPSWFDEDYASDIPQREYDPERAKSLLEKAGMAGLTVDLNTSDVAPAMTESSTLIAEQAKAVGVTINIKKTPADQYYTGPYLKTPFACTSWGGRPMVTFFGLALVSNAPYNETQWKRPAWDRQLLRAYAEPEEAARHEILVDLQQQLWDEGGYIIWGFPNTLDATSSKVKGIVGSVIRPLQYYDFSGAYFE